MPSRISCLRAGVALATSFLSITWAGVAVAQSAANVAQDFLTKIESGNPESVRKVAFEGPIDSAEVGQHGPGRYVIVCMLDIPRGSGAITSIAVTLVMDASSQPRIADYRYGSHPVPACASRI